MKKVFSLLTLQTLLIAAVLSISSLSLFTQSIRLDESQSLWIATKSPKEILRITAQDVHVPLYNLALHFWIQVFGQSVDIARLLSLIFFLLSVPFLYLLTQESSGKKVAMLTIALYSLSPFLIWYTGEVRMYTLFLLVTSASHLYFLRFFRSGGRQYALAYTVSTIAGLYTHYFFVFLVASQLCFIVICRLPNKIRDIRLLLNKPNPYLITLTIAGCFFLPWLYYVYSLGSAVNTQPRISQPTSYSVLESFAAYFLGYQSQSIYRIVISLWPLSAVFLFLLFIKRGIVQLKHLSYFLFVTFLPTTSVFLISYFRPIFLSRYLILVTPSMFLLISWLLLNYPKKIYLSLTALFIFSGVGFSIYQNISPQTPAREDYASVAQYLSTHATPQDIIAISAPFTIYPIEYAYSGQARLTTIPEWNRFVEGPIPQFSIQSLDEQAKEYQHIYRRFFLVLSYDQGYEQDIRNYFDQHYHREGEQLFSSNITVREYILRYDTS